MQTHLILRWPGGRIKALTLSYDDGQAFDKRMVEIMNKYGIKGTFNLNSRESDIGNEKKVQPDEYKEVYKGHEIAIHGKFHVSGKLVPPGTFAYDIIENRKFLEDVTGEIIQGMAYANGSFDETAKEVLKACGVKYARRANASKDFEIPEDWLELVPTCHHDREDSLALADEFLALEEGANWRAFTAKLFFLWGHSYEFDRNNNWELLETFCKKMGNRDDIWYATNVEIYNYVQAFKKLEFNIELTKVYNPTAKDLWFKTPSGVCEIKAGETIEF